MKHSLVILPLALTLSSLTSAQAVNAKPQNNSAAERNTANTTERNKALVLKWSDLLRGNNKDLAAAQALVTDDWVIHGTGVNLPRGPEGLKQWQGYIDAMWFVPRPPATEDIFAEGDRVVRRSTVFRTLKTNNKESAMTVVFIYRIADSKIAEVWRVADGLYSYQQVGAEISMPGTNINADQVASQPAKPEKIVEPKSSGETNGPQTTGNPGEENAAREETREATNERNKALVSRWAAAMWNKDLAAAQALITDDCIIHAAGSTYARGSAGIRQWLADVDSNWNYGGSTTDDIIADGDKVARLTTVFAMYKPNHRGTMTPVIFIYRIAVGKIAEVWRVANYISTYLQAGARIILPGETERSVKKSEAEQEVLKAKQEFDEAALRNDADGRARFYADGYAIVYGDGTLGDKTEQLERVRSGRLRYSARTADDVVLRVYGDTAVIIERRRQSATFDGRARPSDVRATEVWVKRGGDWRLVCTQTTPVLEPVPGPLLPGPVTSPTAGPRKREPAGTKTVARFPQEASQDEQEVLRARQEVDNATTQNDVDALARIYGDDYLFVTYAGTLTNKEYQLESFRSGFMKIPARTAEQVIVRVYGDTAVTITRRKQASTVGTRASQGEQRVIGVWLKRQGRWQLVSGQVTPILEPQNFPADEAALRKEAKPEPSSAVQSLQVKHIRVNDTELAYVEEGAGEPVVLVHGFISDYRTWAAQIHEFAKHYHVIAYSRRYHYPNAWVGDASDYSVDLDVRDLAELIKALNVGPIHLIGHSYGGRVATLVAISHPERVRTLVVAETGFMSLLKPRPEWEQAVADQKKQYEIVSRAERVGGAAEALRAFFEFGGGQGAFDRLPADDRQRYLDNARTVVPARRAMIQSEDFSCEDVQRIKAPFLWVEADSGARVMHLVGEELVKCRPQIERVTIPNAKHGMMRDNPAAFNQAVLAFLQKYSGMAIQNAARLAGTKLMREVDRADRRASKRLTTAIV